MQPPPPIPLLRTAFSLSMLAAQRLIFSLRQASLRNHTTQRGIKILQFCAILSRFLLETKDLINIFAAPPDRKNFFLACS